MFIKPVDADSKLLAENWSPGVGYYTNELSITTRGWCTNYTC